MYDIKLICILFLVNNEFLSHMIVDFCQVLMCSIFNFTTSHIYHNVNEMKNDFVYE